jgi:hypothetical protein
VLEVRVHLDFDWDTLPDDYVLVAIDAAAIVAETIHEPPDDPRAIGDAWIESRRFGLLRVPSWIVPESCNVLINPAHPDASSIQLGTIRLFQFDQRLWGPRWVPPNVLRGLISGQMPQPQPPLQRTQIPMPVHFFSVPSDLLLASSPACFSSSSLVPSTPRRPRALRSLELAFFASA